MFEISKVRCYAIVLIVFSVCLATPVAAASNSTLPESSAPTAVERLVTAVRGLLGIFDNKAPEQVHSGMSIGTASSEDRTLKSSGSYTAEAEEGSRQDNISDPLTGAGMIIHPGG